mmetsp:Transcript_9996/g.28012  ORF Transcript_9996/g.28012 Transcript_9996/m.28012 type:complete len:307 (-) Transcript_9996:258-1178(-)
MGSVRSDFPIFLGEVQHDSPFVCRGGRLDGTQTPESQQTSPMMCLGGDPSDLQESTEGTEAPELEFLEGLGTVVSVRGFVDEFTDEKVEGTRGTEVTEVTEVTATSVASLSWHGGNNSEWFLAPGAMNRRWRCAGCCTDFETVTAEGVHLQCCHATVCRPCLEEAIATKCRLCTLCGEELCAMDICAGMTSAEQWVEADKKTREKPSPLEAVVDTQADPAAVESSPPATPLPSPTPSATVKEEPRQARSRSGSARAVYSRAFNGRSITSLWRVFRPARVDRSQESRLRVEPRPHRPAAAGDSRVAS